MTPIRPIPAVPIKIRECLCPLGRLSYFLIYQEVTLDEIRRPSYSLLIRLLGDDVETALLPDLSSLEADAAAVLTALCRGQVTPSVACEVAAEVVEGLLAREG